MWAEKGQGPPVTGWKTVMVPGSAHTQWLDASKIYSRDATWVSAKEWWYRKKFRIPESYRGQRLRLQFEATDYYADIYLNGHLLGHHEGYMDPFELEITDQARLGDENEILVRI